MLHIVALTVLGTAVLSRGRRGAPVSLLPGSARTHGAPPLALNVFMLECQISGVAVPHESIVTALHLSPPSRPSALQATTSTLLLIHTAPLWGTCITAPPKVSSPAGPLTSFFRFDQFD